VRELRPGDPGRTGPYVLIGRLGEGGMGVVYLARSAGGRAVALKTIHPRLADEPGFRKRFDREVRACRSVGGAGVVPVVDADTDAPVPWLATAYLPGPSLGQAVEAHGPFAEGTWWWLLGSLAEALLTVHAAGLVHRDLKPSNVLLTLDGPRLIDFGIARAADETAITTTGMIVGSPGYLAPEQAEGKPVGAASDVFSLGASLVYAARGRGPFGAGSSHELLYRVVHVDPDLSGVPASAMDVIAGMLAKDPARRPSAGDLVARAAEHAQDAEAVWPPAPVAADIARRAEELLNLDLGAPTVVLSSGPPDPRQPGPADAPEPGGPARTRVLPPTPPAGPGSPADGAVRGRPGMTRRNLAVAGGGRRSAGTRGVMGGDERGRPRGQPWGRPRGQPWTGAPGLAVHP
jgi:eukaryotic-like serine/threonine-protein kinase